MNNSNGPKTLTKNYKFSQSAFDFPTINSQKLTSRNNFLQYVNVLKSQKRMNKSNKKNNSINLKPFNDYALQMNTIMKNYKGEHDPYDVITNRNEQSSEVKSYMKNFKEFNKSICKGLDSSLCHITIEQEEYKSPLDSHKRLENNKNVYNKIITNNKLRHVDQFSKIMDDLKKKKLITLKKLRISNVQPKNNELILYVQGKNDLEQLSISGPTNSNGNTELFGYYLYAKKALPESREQFSICYDMFNILIFGGISTKSYNDTWSLDVKNIEWNKINYQVSSPNARFGHTATLFQKKLILFGGRTKQNSYCFNADIEILNLEDKHWENHPISKNYLKTRRNHIAELINNQILVHGGFDEENEILDDCHLLNLSNTLKWVTVSIDGNITSPSLAGHASCLVLPNDIRYHPKMNIYKYPEDKIQRRISNKIKEKGIYIFGGRSKENYLSNDLYVLKIGKKPLEWIKPEFSGKPPSARYLHTLNYYEDGNYLILYGGRNDFDSDNFALDDIYLLELTKLEWIKMWTLCCCMLYHLKFISAHNLIVMGGMNNKNYVGSSLFFIELSKKKLNEDSVNVNKNEKIQKRRMEMGSGEDCNNYNEYGKNKKRSPGKIVPSKYNLILPPIK